MGMPETLAVETLEAFWSQRIPVDPKKVATHQGVQVFEDADLQIQADGPFSGTFGYENGRPVIRYNPADIKVRQRFTIAHELGHFALGHGDQEMVFRDPKQNFSLNHYDPQEAEANRFAAELLMPSASMRHAVIDRKIFNLDELAKMFDVSEVAIRYRLKNLGLLTP